MLEEHNQFVIVRPSVCTYIKTSCVTLCANLMNFLQHVDSVKVSKNTVQYYEPEQQTGKTNCIRNQMRKINTSQKRLTHARATGTEQA